MFNYSIINVIDDDALKIKLNRSKFTVDQTMNLSMMTYIYIKQIVQQNRCSKLKIDSMANYGKRIYYDPQPQIIRWPNKRNPLTYHQNVYLRFLKPPPVPAPEVVFLFLSN